MNFLLAGNLVIANGENAANGAGITTRIALRLMSGGVDVITTGNHVWRQKEVYAFLAADERFVRPANYPPGAPGRGLTVRPARSVMFICRSSLVVSARITGGWITGTIDM